MSDFDAGLGRGTAILCAFLIAVALVASLVTSAFAGDRSKWTWYEKTQGTSHVDSIKIDTRCINGEDSAGHLKLVGYDGGTAVYTCYHSGY
jgi:ethanolamine utilization protein EutP (predicted NTPase)